VAITMWQTTSLDRAIAEELFGWKWWSWVGIPIRGTPGYPTKTRVRQFVSPEQLADKRWEKFLEASEGAPATGDEPLDYSYCSSQGGEWVPHFSGHLNACAEMESELEKRGLAESYLEHLRNYIEQVDGSEPTANRIHRAQPQERCMAALAAVGSKYIKVEQVE